MSDLAPAARGRRSALGAVALAIALGVMVLPALVAIIDPQVLVVRRDSGWLGSSIARFVVLQTGVMLLPLLLGLLAVARDRGRAYGVTAAVIALLGNFLLLRAVLALVAPLFLVS